MREGLKYGPSALSRALSHPVANSSFKTPSKEGLQRRAEQGFGRP